MLGALLLAGSGCTEPNDAYNRQLADGAGGSGGAGAGGGALGHGGVGGMSGPDGSDVVMPPDEAPGVDGSGSDAGQDGPGPDVAADVVDARLDSLDPPIDFTTGLIGYWPLNEGAGTAVSDLSSNHNDGAFAGIGAGSWQPGKTGPAVDIPDVAGAAIVVPPSVSIDSIRDGLTITAWVFRNASISDRNFAVASRQLPDTNRELFNLAFQSGALVAWFAESASIAVRSTQAAPLMAWTHVAVTWDGSAVRVYQDGALVGMGSYTGRLAATTTPLILGNNANRTGLDQPLVGRLDEVRLYSRALPAEAIQALWSANLSLLTSAAH